MKILLINDIGSEAGGVETMILQLTESLTAQGHTVKLLTGNEYPHSIRINDYEFKSFKNDSWKRFFLYIYNPYSAISLKKVLREFKPDIVHIHNMSKASSSILFQLKRHPAVMTVHDAECIDQTVFNKIYSLHRFKEQYTNYFKFNRGLTYYIQKLRFKILRYAQKNIDLFISPSNAMANVIKEGGLPAPIRTIHNGIQPHDSPKSVKYSKEPSRILFVGRLVNEKGVMVLVRAIKEIVVMFPALKLTIVGDGPTMSTIREYLDENNLKKYVNLASNVKHDDIYSYYENTDIFVVPSTYFEPLGVVAIEAMMAGRPVIASAAGGLVELVDDGITGILVEPGNVTQLADSIINLLNDHKMIEKMGRAGLKKSAAFSATNYIDQTISTYKDVISKYQS